MKQSIGEFLATLRKAHGYTQRELAERLGVSNKTVSAWERGTVLPDILLLPALAEIYGVTADEILNGERKEGTPPAFSEEAESKLLKRRSARFAAQSDILLGVTGVGLLLFFVGWYLDATTVAWTGWKWWLLLLFTGLVAFSVALACLAAFFKSAETAGEEADRRGAYRILLHKRVALCSCLAGAECLLFSLVALFRLLERAFSLVGATDSHADRLTAWISETSGDLLAVTLVFFALFAALFFFGIFFADAAWKKWGGKEAAARRKRNGKLYRKTALIGLVPLAAAVVCMAVIPFVDFERREVYYSADKKAFTDYMESMRIEGKEYRLPLSETEKKLGVGSGETETIRFDGMEFRIRYEFSKCVVSYTKNDGLVLTGSADKMIAEDGFSVYNLRFAAATAAGSNKDDGWTFRLRTEGDRAYLERYRTENYAVWSGWIGSAAIVLDLAVCCFVCLGKREKTKISL